VALDGRHGLSGITFAAGVLSELRRYAQEEHREDREAAGVLLGQRVDSVLQVTSFQPIWRSEFGAKHFALNEAELRQLRKQILKWKSGARHGGVELLGWFRAYGRGDAYLDSADFELHREFFSSPAHLAMALRPSHQKPVIASLYMRDQDGHWRTREPLATIPLPDSGGATSFSVRRPEVRLVRGLRAGARLYMPIRYWLLYFAALCLAGASVVAFLQAQAVTDAGHSLNLSARVDRHQLILRWNPHAAPRRAWPSAFVIVAGERRNLSDAEFAAGELQLPILAGESRDLDIHLHAAEIEDSTHLILALR